MCLVNESKDVEARGAVAGSATPPQLPPRGGSNRSLPPNVVPYQNVQLNPTDQTFRPEDNRQESRHHHQQRQTHLSQHHHQSMPMILGQENLHQSENNLRQIHEILRLNKIKLEESGWYYGQMTWLQSTNMLKNSPEGTFLVRDSSDPRFLYTLSVQRGPDDGPTSVRIHFSDGKFRLDAEDKIQNLMPSFTSIADLVEYYCNIRAKSHMWIDMSGEISPSIWLKAPLLKKVPTLAHSARLSVQKNMKSQDSEVKNHIHNHENVKLPFLITRYLQEYPHTM